MNETREVKTLSWNKNQLSRKAVREAILAQDRNTILLIETETAEKAAAEAQSQ